MERLLRVILEDDSDGMKVLLGEDPLLSGRRVETPRLYEGGIRYWLYAGDTALHLAAAGYRVEIVELLLAAGADSGAIGLHRLAHWWTRRTLTGRRLCTGRYVRVARLR